MDDKFEKVFAGLWIAVMVIVLVSLLLGSYIQDVLSSNSNNQVEDVWTTGINHSVSFRE